MEAVSHLLLMYFDDETEVRRGEVRGSGLGEKRKSYHGAREAAIDAERRATSSFSVLGSY